MATCEFRMKKQGHNIISSPHHRLHLMLQSRLQNGVVEWGGILEKVPLERISFLSSMDDDETYEPDIT